MKSKAYLLLVSVAALFHLLWFFRADLAPYSFFGFDRASIDAVNPYPVPHPWKTAAALMGDVLQVILFGPEQPEPVYCLEVLEPVEVVAPRPLPVPSVSSPPSAGRAGEE